MSALSIRRMNFTLQAMEHIQAEEDAARYAALPAEKKADHTHYWWIERKSKRGKKWIFVRYIQATKKEIAAIFIKHYKNREDKYRIRHSMTY